MKNLCLTIRNLCIVVGWIVILAVVIAIPPFSSTKPLPDTPQTPLVPQVVETSENLTEPTENIKEPTKRRPSKFRKFRVVVEITTKEPKDDNYVKQETNKLIGLAKSMGADDLRVIKLEGISVRKDKEQSFDIDLK